MVEVSEIGLKEEELELDLGLSIGGCFRKPEKSKVLERELGISFVSRSNSVEEVDNQTILLRSSTSPSEIDGVNGIVNLQTKREIHALRRQEAKKKQREKRFRGRNSVIENSIEEKRSSKREKIDTNGFESNGVIKSVNLNISNGQTENYLVQYTYPPVQFVPYSSKFVYPCLMPCLNPSENEKNGVQPVFCRGFRSFSPDQSLGLNGKRDVQTIKTRSNGSQLCSSSSASDHRISSQEGGGSSDTGTNYSFSLKKQKGSKENGTNGHFEQSACSYTTESAQGSEERTHYNEKFTPKLANHLNSIDSKEETTLQLGSEPLPVNKSRSTTEDSTPSDPLIEAKVDCGKPPKPQTRNWNKPTPPQMPYVSTTGNGPNGKTITGLLYRYTNSEVSIICDCHRSTFSPAQFVEHAGATDIINPLKHINVFPSASF